MMFIALAFGWDKGLGFGHSTVRAVGDLSVDWGVPEGEAIFEINNFAPGDSMSKDVYVVNNASTVRPVGVRGIKTAETGGLADKLLIIISVDSVEIYGIGGSKSLSQFFTESSGPDGLELVNFNPGADRTLSFKVIFNPDAGNGYQDASVIFDLKIGLAVEIPAPCQSIKFAGDPIFGTENNDNIRGTNKNDLIYAFEGNDRVQSSNGNDCVVGGPGEDNINNSNGNDILFGNTGDDILQGSNGNDQIFGGPGNDRLYGGNGNDNLEGGEGDDYLDGGNGNDQINAGTGDDELKGSNGNDMMRGDSGNDRMEGGNGNDELFGDFGDDRLYGGNGNDLLDGGGGNDEVWGNLGKDTCLAEAVSSCEF